VCEMDRAFLRRKHLDQDFEASAIGRQPGIE
jgi:hypothetical protein